MLVVISLNLSFSFDLDEVYKNLKLTNFIDLIFFEHIEKLCDQSFHFK